MEINASFSDFITKSVFSGQDIWINSHIINVQNPALNKIMIILTNMLSPELLLALSILLFFVLVHKKKWHESILLALSIIIGLATVELIKMLVRRPRPENSLIKEAGYSFPSTHSAIAIIYPTSDEQLYSRPGKNHVTDKPSRPYNLFLFHSSEVSATRS